MTERFDAEGDLVGPGDHAAQTRQAVDNLGQRLKRQVRGGRTRSRLRCTSSRRTGRIWPTCGASPAAAAASTLLGVSLLGYGGQLVEIEAVAVAGNTDVAVG